MHHLKQVLKLEKPFISDFDRSFIYPERLVSKFHIFNFIHLKRMLKHKG